MCCTRLAANAGPPKIAKIGHLGTIAQFCRAISSQLRHVLTIGKIVKQQYLLHMYPQYWELRRSSGWDLLASLGYPSKFQRVSCLGSVTARHSSSGRQPNFAALSRGRHLYSAGRPSRWALAHILVVLKNVLKTDNTFQRTAKHGMWHTLLYTDKLTHRLMTNHEINGATSPNDQATKASSWKRCLCSLAIWRRCQRYLGLRIM